MSNVYHTEPPTSGKVLLKTTYGDIDVELWSKEAPLACRNFIQLSLEGYYDGTIFHRVISKFMVQGGDKTGSGKGGESIYYKPFKDECHSRIRFNHRGQVAMANENEPNTNRSQFFFTLDKAEWLNNKHTIFGKITGNTVFNALRMGDVETDANDRPLDPPKLLAVEILHNPFDDIVPRDIATERKKIDRIEPAPKPKGKKDLKVLSFGGEDEELGFHTHFTGGIKSAHDILKDEKLSRESAYENLTITEIDKNTEQQMDKTSKEDTEMADIGKPEDFMEEMKQKMRNTQRRLDASKKGKFEENDLTVTGLDIKKEYETDALDQIRIQRDVAIREKAKEYERLRSELRSKQRAVNVVTGADRQELDAQLAHHEMLSHVEQMRQKFKKHKTTQSGSREAETLSKLASFSKNLRKKHENKLEVPVSIVESEECQLTEKPYSGQLTEGNLYEGNDSGDESKTWFDKPLKFKGPKHIDDKFRYGSDGRQATDYSVIDPRKAK